MDNKTLLLEQFNKYKGQLVITDNWDVQRFVALGTDNFDYYYIMYNGRKFTWFTCVGNFIPLKNKINSEHYQKLIRVAELNHLDQEKYHFSELTEERKLEIQNHKAGLINLTSSDKFLTTVYWDLN